jgi:hypothetical protein
MAVGVPHIYDKLAVVAIGHSVPSHFRQSPQGGPSRTRCIGEGLAFVVRGAEVAIVRVDKEAGHA